MIILLDPGHGYNTKGKQSPIIDASMDIWSVYTEDGRFKEYLYTRIIAEDVEIILKSMGYDARLLVTEKADISLKERVDRVNKICLKEGTSNVILVSVHANAAGDGTNWSSARGWECYTTSGTTKSDKLAECLYRRAEENFKGMKIRKDLSDGDSDKESNFYIIKNCLCPAILTENFFYDNKEDLKYMTSDLGHFDVVRTHIYGIIDYIESLKRK